MAVDRQGLIAQAEKYVGDYEAEALIRELVAALSSGDPAARPDGEPREDDGDDIHRSVEYVVTPESKAFERGRKSAVEEIARLRQQLAEMEGRAIAAEAEVEHQIGHKEEYIQFMDAAEARCAALTQERDRLLADWRDQDQALQRIYGEIGEDRHVGCPGDVATYAEEALRELRSHLAQLRAAVEQMLQAMKPIETSAAWAREHSARSPSSHQEFIRQADEDWAAYEAALDRLRRGLQGERSHER